MSLEKIVSEIKKQKGFAESHIDEKVLSTAMANLHVGRKKAAKHKLEQLYLEYKNSFRPRVVFLLTYGSEAEEFAKIASSEAGTETLSGEGFYNHVLDRFDPKFFKQSQTGSFTLDVTNRVLYEVASDLDVASYPLAVFKDHMAGKIKDRKEALEFVKKVITDQVGSEMIGFFLLEQATKIAVNQNFDGKFFPVVVTLKDLSLLKEIKQGLEKVSQHTFTISAGKVAKGVKESVLASLKTADSNTVLEALEKVKAKLSK